MQQPIGAAVGINDLVSEQPKGKHTNDAPDPVHPAGTAHSVAANAANNLVFVPLAANNAFSAFAVPGGGLVDDCEKGCIAVFGRQPSGEDDE